MTAHRWNQWIAISLLFGASGVVHADSAFQERVVPLLEKYCYECHDDLTTKGIFDLFSR